MVQGVQLRVEEVEDTARLLMRRGVQGHTESYHRRPAIPNVYYALSDSWFDLGVFMGIEQAHLEPSSPHIPPQQTTATAVRNNIGPCGIIVV
jgi:hypothetical protein